MGPVARMNDLNARVLSWLQQQYGASAVKRIDAQGWDADGTFDEGDPTFRLQVQWTDTAGADHWTDVEGTDMESLWRWLMTEEAPA